MLRDSLRAMFFRVGKCGFTHPCPVGMRLPARGETLAVTRPVTLHDAPELIPVDLAELPVLGLLVVLEIGIRNLQPDRLRLRDGEVHEALPELVVRLPLHA